MHDGGLDFYGEGEEGEELTDQEAEEGARAYDEVRHEKRPHPKRPHPKAALSACPSVAGGSSQGTPCSCVR